MKYVRKFFEAILFTLCVAVIAWFLTAIGWAATSLASQYCSALEPVTWAQAGTVTGAILLLWLVTSMLWHGED